LSVCTTVADALHGPQIADIILAWLAAEDDGARNRITELLQKSNQTLKNVASTLEEVLTGLEEGDDEDDHTRDMLTTLISCL